MLTRLQGLFTSAVLTLASGCGGEVVVDRDWGPRDEYPVDACYAYCNLVHTAEDACRVFEWCMDGCVEAVTRAKEEGCSKEMLAIYECWGLWFKKTGFCQGGACDEEVSAYNTCRPQDGNHE